MELCRNAASPKNPGNGSGAARSFYALEQKSVDILMRSS